MGLWLKQSTAVTVKVGPFIDDTDGKTAETALTITQAEVRISKNGANIIQKNESTSLATDELGYYDCLLDTTDTNTLGVLQLFVHESGALPVFHEYIVVPANVWDSYFSTDLLQVDVREKGASGLDFTTTEKASINTEVDNGLNTAIPASNTADSVNDILLDTLGTDVWATATKALTDKAGFSLAADQSAVTIGTINTVGDKTGYGLSAAAIDSIWDEVTEGTLTVRQAMRLSMAMLASKSSGGGTNTLIYRDYGDTKPRLTFTVDADGNRTAATQDGT